MIGDQVDSPPIELLRPRLIHPSNAHAGLNVADTNSAMECRDGGSGRGCGVAVHEDTIWAFLAEGLFEV